MPQDQNNLLQLHDIVLLEVQADYEDTLRALEKSLEKLTNLRLSIESSYACLSDELREPLKEKASAICANLFQMQCAKFRLSLMGVINTEITEWAQKNGPAN